MQRFAKRTAAVAVATVALLFSGVGAASADDTGNSNGSILSGNNIGLGLLNNVTLCDISVGAILGIATSSGCAVENTTTGDGGNTTGNSNGSILSGNNIDADILNNLSVCDVAVAAVLATATTGGCTVENTSEGGDGGDSAGNSNGSIASGNNIDLDVAENVTVCGVSVAVLGIANTPPCEVTNTEEPPDEEEPPGNGGNGGNGDNGNNGNNGAHQPPPSGGGGGMLASTGAGAVAALAPVGLALVLAGVGLFRRFRGGQDEPIEVWE